MIREYQWYERNFSFDMPVWMYPNIVERLRGTPARLDEAVAPLDRNLLTRRHDEEWSIQENAGHLWDLELLWLERLQELLRGAETLRSADLSNRKTYEANHNADTIANILAAFRAERLELVQQLDELEEADVLRSALHPRLKQPMRLIDLTYFVAEHDDHHLAQITRLKRRLTSTESADEA